MRDSTICKLVSLRPFLYVVSLMNACSNRWLYRRDMRVPGNASTLSSACHRVPAGCHEWSKAGEVDEGQQLRVRQCWAFRRPSQKHLGRPEEGHRGDPEWQRQQAAIRGAVQVGGSRLAVNPLAQNVKISGGAVCAQELVHAGPAQARRAALHGRHRVRDQQAHGDGQGGHNSGDGRSAGDDRARVGAPQADDEHDSRYPDVHGGCR